MSVSTRGPSASTANVSRDYGLLQAPISSVHPAPAIGHDEVEGPAVDDEEHAEALRAVRRYQATGSVFDPHQAPVSEVARSVRPSSSRGQLAERTDSLRAPSRGRQTLSEAASAVSSSSVGGSRDPSLSPSASRNALSPSPTGARPLSFFRSPSRQGGKRLSRYTDCGEGSSLASRYRDLVLGGEPVPPPLEQVQQHFLRQHYPVDPNDPGSAPTHTTAHGPSQAHTTSTRHSINHQNSHATHRNSDYKSFERRWSRSSAVVPRQADVAHVLEQLHLSHASPADIEESAAHHAHERTPLVPSRPTSSYAAPLAPAPGGSGISARTAVPREHAHESHISFIPAHPTVPGPEAFKEELKTISQYTLPIWATHILELSINSITVLVLGHLGTTELAAASLASLTGNVTGFSVIQGFVSALDSLLPAAYSSDRPSAVGLWTQRMAVIIVALLVPISVIWFNAESILLALKQEPHVAHLAAIYLRIMIISLPAYAGFETIRRYLQAQGLFSAPTIAVAVASVINVFAQFLLVHGPIPVRLGFLGAPIASTVSYWIMLLFGLFQCWVAPRDAWGGLSRKAFDIGGLLVVWNLGLASTLAMAAEWWAWEVANLLSSVLGTTALAAQSVLLVACSLTYQLPSGIGVAGAVRVGNLLGANQPAWAALSARTAMAFALFVGFADSGLLVAFRNQLGYIFSSDKDLIFLIGSIVPYVGAFQVCDSLCAVASGILRGSGRQAQGAVINIFAYYVAGLPLAGYLLLYCDWGLQGVWLGLATGLALASIGFMLIIWRTDWDDEATKVLSRMTEEAVPNAVTEANIEANIDAVLEEVGSIAEEDEDGLDEEPIMKNKSSPFP